MAVEVSASLNYRKESFELKKRDCQHGLNVAM